MHAEFDPQNVDWNSFIRVPEVDTSDSSKSIDILQTAQFGNGYSHGYAVFSGSPYQRGAGIGSLFRSFWRYLIPIGKNIAAAVGKQGLQSGTQVLNDVLDWKNLKNALADEGRSGLKNLLDKASNNLAGNQVKMVQALLTLNVIRKMQATAKILTEKMTIWSVVWGYSPHLLPSQKL